MKTVKFIVLIFILLMPVHSVFSQENSNVPKRTPEQEAAKQTEKLQQELDLSQDQAEKLYQINLKYARERQISNTRSEAMERMKNKNAEIQGILNNEQNARLQSKRYERTSFDAGAINREQPLNSSGFRSPTMYRTVPPTNPTTDQNLRRTFRQVNPQNRPETNSNQSIQRNPNSSVPPRTQQLQNNPSYRSGRESGGYNRSSESPAPSRNTPSYTPRSSSSGSGSAPQRSESTTNSRRK